MERTLTVYAGTRRVVLSLIACLLLLALSQISIAQGTASLRGTVTDPQSSVITGATVVLENSERGLHLQTASNKVGLYEFLQVPPGTYHLAISAPGFKSLSKENLVLEVASPAIFNATLTVGAIAERVEVTSEAPVINSSDATLGNNFNNKQVLDLPSEGRNPVELLSLQPGVTYTGNQIDPSADSRSGSVNGARSDQTNLTVDGLDNNDQLLGQAFTGVLRVPSESIQEFRVTTSSSNADTGRSSGGQVALSTKSGTNSFHGALYEYNRTSLGQANDWFNKRAELQSGEPNKPGQLIRNTFGGAIGGPIKKDRMFFFLNYEGQRSREAVQVTQSVPSDQLRQGIIQYPCDNVNDPNCTTSNPAVSVTNQGGTYVAALNQAQILATDCQTNCQNGSGVNQAILALWNGQATLPNGNSIPAYPHSNTFGGDGLNILGYTFAAPQPANQNTYLARVDYNLTRSQQLFVRGNLMGDRTQYAPQFPGQPPSSVYRNNSKGLFVGYTAAITSNLVNNLRYGLIREGVYNNGLNPFSHANFSGMSSQISFARTTLVNVPVHQIVDDVAWTHGKHTWQFGGNWRVVINNRQSDAQNYFSANTEPTNLAPAGFIAGSGQALDPDNLASSGYPLVGNGFGGSYDVSITDLTGVFGAMNAVYAQDKSGTSTPSGALISRHFKANEFELYGQDVWHVTPNLTLTFGLRYSLLQPPYETTGNQVTPYVQNASGSLTPGLGYFFQQRANAMNQGKTFNQPIVFQLGGQTNGKQPYWNWDYKDISPRFAFAWAPKSLSGWRRSLLGRDGATSIRGGYGMYYDHFGEGIVNTFDRQGSMGLTTFLGSEPYVEYPNCAVRFTGLTSILGTNGCPIPPNPNPAPQLPSAPPHGFPFTPPGAGQNGGFAYGWGLNDRMKTPYSHVFDLSISRELPQRFSIEVSYDGRLGHRLLQQLDLAQPLNIRDPKSGQTYYQAAQLLAKAAAANTPESQIQPLPFWEAFFGTGAQNQAAGPGGISGYAPGIPANPTATQNIYDLYYSYGVNQVGALQTLDTLCFPGCAQLVGQSAPTTYNFYDPQFSTMFSWTSSGYSYYHGLLLTLRRHSGPLQFDFNYTFSKSIDLNSNAERISFFENGGSLNASATLTDNNQAVNAWMPAQMKGPSDYDLRHQINFNWIYQLPFGRGQKILGGASKALDTAIGGWEVAGLGRWTSGFSFTMSSFAYPTNYLQDAHAFLIGHLTSGTYIDANGQPNDFKESQISLNNVASQFRFAYPGESGQRDNLRGPGYFDIDLSLGKTFKITENQALRFQWDTYNVTNAVRFDVGTISDYLFYSATLGEFTSTLSKPRVMQFGLRYSF